LLLKARDLIFLTMDENTQNPVEGQNNVPQEGGDSAAPQAAPQEGGEQA